MINTIKPSSSFLWECGKVKDFSIVPQNKKTKFRFKNLTENCPLLWNNNPVKGGSNLFA